MHKLNELLGIPLPLNYVSVLSCIAIASPSTVAFPVRPFRTSQAGKEDCDIPCRWLTSAAGSSYCRAIRVSLDITAVNRYLRTGDKSTRARAA
jgi:hypothetical protein